MRISSHSKSNSQSLKSAVTVGQVKVKARPEFAPLHHSLCCRQILVCPQRVIKVRYPATMITQTPSSELNTDMKSSFSKTVWRRFERRDRDQILHSALVGERKYTGWKQSPALRYFYYYCALIQKCHLWRMLDSSFWNESLHIYFISDLNIEAYHQS